MRRTAFKRKSRKVKTPAEGSGREATWLRARGKCDLCNLRISTHEIWEQHHAFYRSQVRKDVVDEAWNRTCLHRACHVRAHTHPADRGLLEEQALLRLMDTLTLVDRNLLHGLQRGVTPQAVVRAYEKLRGLTA